MSPHETQRWTDEVPDRLTAALVTDAARWRRAAPAGLVERIQAQIAEEPRRPRSLPGIVRLAAAAAVLAIGVAVWPREEAPAVERSAPFVELASVEDAVTELPRRLTENLAEPLTREAESLAAAGSSAARRFRIRGPLQVFVPFLGSR